MIKSCLLCCHCVWVNLTGEYACERARPEYPDACEFFDEYYREVK